MLSLFLILAISTTAFTYDINLAQHYVNLAQATYKVSNVNKWNCETCEPTFVPDYIVEHSGVRAIQGYDSRYNVIFTAFRGSTNIQNWLDNIQVSKISPYNDTSISVERGFYKAYLSVQDDLFDNMYFLTRQYNIKTMIITGHSLGGALSTIFAYEIMTSTYDMRIRNIITFGSPRVGNYDFVKSFELYNVPSYRITHYRDVVPHVPEELLGYLHISNEIWYNEDSSSYKICDDYKCNEDETCSNSCSPTHCTSMSDHMMYLNTPMGTDA